MNNVHNPSESFLDQVEVGLNRAKVLERLKCSRPQLTRDLAILVKLGLPKSHFDYIPHERWFSMKSVEVLEKYRSLVRERGGYKAVEEIVRLYGKCKESS